MHTLSLPSPEAVAAVVAVLGVSGTICSQADDGTWRLGVPDASAAQADALAAKPPAPTADDLRAYAATARYAKETGGLEVAGAPIATDRDSQAMINAAYAWSAANPNVPVTWKTASGFVTLSATQIAAIAMAVGAHVQACFTAEGQVDAAITGGTITTTAEVDAAFAAVAT